MSEKQKKIDAVKLGVGVLIEINTNIGRVLGNIRPECPTWKPKLTKAATLCMS